MSTTMLERANPLNELRPAPLKPHRARRVLAELDQEIETIFHGLEPVRPRKPVATPYVRRPELAPIRPAPVSTEGHTEPRRSPYPVAWNMPVEKPKPRRRLIPRISVLRVARPGPALPAEMPRSLTWLPMMRGHEDVNAQLDTTWRAWLSGWDRTIVIGYRLARARLMMLRIEERSRHQKIAAKLRRITEYHTRGAWQDYLDAFGPLEGTQNTCTHVLGELEKLDALVQP